MIRNDRSPALEGVLNVLESRMAAFVETPLDTRRRAGCRLPS